MSYVADLNPSNGQVVALRTVSSPATESPTVRNVTDEQYVAMKDNAIMWHFNVSSNSFVLGLLPDPNVNINPLGALDLAKYNAKLAVSAFGLNARSTLAGGASALEVAGWTRYVQLATKSDAGTLTADETAALQLEVTLRGRGETVAQLIAKVKANDVKYTKAQAAVNGMLSAANTAIDQCTTAQAVNTTVQQLKTAAQAQMAALLAA